MEIRLKPWEIGIVTIGLLAAGVIIGFIIKGHYGDDTGYLHLGMVLLVPLTMIMRRRYKTAPAS